MPDHIHMLISIPPKYSVSQVIGYLKGKSAIQIARTYTGRKKNFTGQHFWARGYFVTTVGANILKPLWEKVGPDVSHKVRIANHLRLFDAARVKVRTWEALHAKDNVWNMNVQ